MSVTTGCASFGNDVPQLSVLAIHYEAPSFSKLKAIILKNAENGTSVKRLPYSFVVFTPQEMTGNMEYNFYAGRIAAGFTEGGLGKATSTQKADYVVTFTYGVDKGVKRIVTTPITGVVGTASTFAHANVNTYGDSASINGFSYNIPQYGIVGTDTHSVTDYTKFLVIEMYNRRTGKKIMQAKAVAVNEWPNFSLVGKCLVRAAMESVARDASGNTWEIKKPLPCP